ncbi:hypothethical protein (plasmid) [Ralstonia solanacearum PSI07]|nr:hypothethical protein [Ralstonia solanacearum PSI07]
MTRWPYKAGEPSNSESLQESINCYKAVGLLSPGLIAIKLEEEMRDIVTRLVAYANPIPPLSVRPESVVSNT